MAGTKQAYGIGNIVSWGATVVIIGLLFKIQHWPYGGIFISIGLGAEALLFFILGFAREERGIDWTRAYPELKEDYDGELPTSGKKSIGGGGSGYSSTAALDKMLEDAKIGPELIGSLATGLSTFGDKVASISRVTDAGDATIAFTNKLKMASASYESLSHAFEKASANLNEMGSSNVDAKTYHEQVNKMAQNLTSLNAVYELELEDSSSHLKSMSRFYEDMSTTMKSFSDSAADSKQFKEEVGKLAKNLSTLNSIYGNMLSAMNQPRAN